MLCKKRSVLISIGIALVMVAILVTGLLTYRDYGYTCDENLERITSTYNYQYLAKLISGREIHRIESGELHSYFDRYYGVIFQLPMVLMEDLFGFELSLSDTFFMRHLMTFLFCFIGWVCFYFFLKRVFHHRGLALLGMLMVCLYPRFWGEQFNNVKDMIFTASVCECLLCGSLLLSHDGEYRYEFLFAFVCAMCVCTRVIGLMIPLIFFGYRVLRDLCLEKGLSEEYRQSAQNEALWQRLLRYCLGLVLLLCFYIIVYPVCWEEPLKTLKEAFVFFSSYWDWSGPVMFLGHMEDGYHLPWYYIPVWLGLSLPLWYLALLGGGIISGGVTAVKQTAKGRVRQYLLGERRWALLSFILAFAPVAVMVFTPLTLYNGWRHMFYILPELVVIMLFALRGLWRGISRLKKPGLIRGLRGACALLCVGMLGYQVGWIIRWHPMEKIYFNPIGKSIAEGMDRDWWYESIYHQFEYILDLDESDTVKVSCNLHTGDTYLYMLPEEMTDRIEMISEGDTDAEYIIETIDSLTMRYFGSYYTCIHEMKVDGVPISRVYARNDVIEERLDDELFDEEYWDYNDFDDGLEHEDMGYELED